MFKTKEKSIYTLVGLELAMRGGVTSPNGVLNLPHKTDVLRGAQIKERSQMTKKSDIHKWVEEAKQEAHRNLSGEDLEKCLTALDNWERNNLETIEKWGARYAHV